MGTNHHKATDVEIDLRRIQKSAFLISLERLICKHKAESPFVQFFFFSSVNNVENQDVEQSQPKLSL